MQLQDLTNSERIFVVPYDDKVTVNLRHVARDELRDIYRKATSIKYVDHKPKEETDIVKADCKLGRLAIKGWSGIADGDQEAPCTPENIDLIMSKHNVFARWLNDIVGDIDRLIEMEREAERKNCLPTSDTEQTSQELPAKTVETCLTSME